MIKSLRDARITDGSPRLIVSQDWVQIISKVFGTMHEKVLDLADKSQIYTELGNASEPVLDALAVNWRIDWYDTGYSLEKKREIVQSALEVRRTMGTVRATRLQADSIYKGTMLEEWFEYGGEPGYFRLMIDITNSTEKEPVIALDPEEMERELTAAKRWSAHMESLSYMVKHALLIGAEIKSWAYRVPFCGTIRCGEYWKPSTLGWSVKAGLCLSEETESFCVSPEFCGTLPQVSTLGYSVACGMVLSGGVKAQTVSPELCGTLPKEGDHGD